MKRFDLQASKEIHCNGVMKGSEKFHDLPVTHVHYSDGGKAIISTWRVPFLQRLKFIFDGRIQLAVISESHPPVAISVGHFC